MNSHWPATYLKLGLMMRSSIAPAYGINVTNRLKGSLMWRRTTGVNKDLRQAGGTPRTDLTPNPLSKVDNARPDGEPPTFVSQAVLRRIEGERGDVVGIRRVTDEASGGMGVETDHEEEREVVSVPEGFETLVADFVVRRGIHKDHDEKHEVASDASRLRVVDVQGDLRTDLCGKRG